MEYSKEDIEKIEKAAQQGLIAGKMLRHIVNAVNLLKDHSNGDFVSKSEANEAAGNLLDFLFLNQPEDHDHGIPFIIAEILNEVARAEKKHPEWPSDYIYAAAIVGEENGELTRAANQYQSAGGKLEEVRKEATQTAATCIRLLKRLSEDLSVK